MAGSWASPSDYWVRLLVFSYASNPTTLSEMLALKGWC